jgi:hypothetical protein
MRLHPGAVWLKSRWAVGRPTGKASGKLCEQFGFADQFLAE